MPPESFLVGSAVFHYLGPAFAVLLMERVEPLGVAWLRIASAAVILSAWRRPWRAARKASPATRRRLLELGALLAVMNACFYLAIDRLPLATVAAIEFVPVVVLAAAGARTPRNVSAVLLACLGVYVITGVQIEGEPVALAFAFANALLFARYIMLGHGNAREATIRPLDGLAAAMLVALVVVTPIGFIGVSSTVFDPMLLGAGIGVGICSSVVPYVFDQLAMSQVSRSAYALMTALLPAMAVVIGLVTLDQVPTRRELLGVALVVLAISLGRESRGCK